MPTGTAVFLDTSVQIARLVHAPSTKRRIEERIRGYTFAVTGGVVRQEFKRRLLKEAKYLLGLLDETNSFKETYQQVVRLPRQLERKKNISLQIIGQVFEGAGDQEVAERLKIYLHSLLILGLGEFDDSVGQVIWDAQCGCSTLPIQEKVRYKRYEFGPDKCTDSKLHSCGIADFLKKHETELRAILNRLASLPSTEKTKELAQAELFISAVLKDATQAIRMNPCYKVGDLIIALESVGIPAFYTFNGKESQHLSRELGQDLIVGHPNPKRDEVECHRTIEQWPKF